MSKRYSSTEVTRALGRLGYQAVGQSGSHLKLRHTESGRTVIVKHPAREIPAGTFASILRQAGLTSRDFEAALRGEARRD